MTRPARTRRLPGLGAVAVVAFIALTGCLGGDDAGTGPPPPPVIAKVGTDPTEIVAGGDFGDSIRVRVTDPSGNPRTGLVVSFAVSAGAGSVSPATATTDAQGRAAARFTTATAVGSNSATATVTGGSSVSFSLVTVPGLARSIAFARRVAVVELGAPFSPEVIATDANGNAVPASRLLFDNRTLGIVTVAPGGAVTAQRQGQTILVASSPGGAADSLLLIAVAPNGPLVMTDLPRFDLPSDTTVDVIVSLDMRSAPERLGSATVRIQWDPAQLSLVSHAFVAPGVESQVNAGNASRGTLTLAVASVAGFAGRTALVRLTLRASRATGRAGALGVAALELFSAGGFADLLPRTTAVIHPLVLR